MSTDAEEDETALPRLLAGLERDFSESLFNLADEFFTDENMIDHISKGCTRTLLYIVAARAMMQASISCHLMAQELAEFDVDFIAAKAAGESMIREVRFHCEGGDGAKKH